jgi:predicted Zn-dependent peptidase
MIKSSTVKVSTLPNGLRVATDSMAEAESVAVGAWVGVGTRDEPWGANGVAHLAEHMFFKGTKTRSAYALSAAIEKKGGSTNAHTMREETAYYARVLPEDVGLATDIIADMLQHSVFDAKELTRERKVVVQEIGRDLDSPEDCTFELMHATAFPGQRIGRPILGSAKVIEKMPRADVADYVKKHYTAANMAVVAAGKVDHAAFVELAKQRWGRLPRGTKTARVKAQVKAGSKYTAKDIEQLHFILGFPAPGFRDKKAWIAQLLSILLGGSASSRLFQKVREKKGLVYTINASHMPFSDAGIFYVYAGTDPLRAGELVPAICNELVDVTRHIGEAELKRAKAQARAEILMSRENVMRRADILGHQLLAFGKPIAIEKTLKKIESVTVKEVRDMACKLFKQKPIVLGFGPIGKLEDYRKIEKRLRGCR